LGGSSSGRWRSGGDRNSGVSVVEEIGGDDFEVAEADPIEERRGCDE
jgi:hypothetical protein